jgi:hypothetical protein
MVTQVLQNCVKQDWKDVLTQYSQNNTPGLCIVLLLFRCYRDRRYKPAMLSVIDLASLHPSRDRPRKPPTTSAYTGTRHMLLRLPLTVVKTGRCVKYAFSPVLFYPTLYATFSNDSMSVSYDPYCCDSNLGA